MRESQFRRRFIFGVIVCGALAFLLGRFGMTGLERQWRNLRDGMTQAEVKQVLGLPSSTGKTSTIGAGGQLLTRWEYKRGRQMYCVDFDYIGPGGAPVVYRTERYSEEWNWPPWWPWRLMRARAMA